MKINLQVRAADLESGKYRSDLSLPNGVVIKESGIPKAGSGVWAETPVPKGVRFGPYEGTLVDDIEDAHSGYCWQVRPRQLSQSVISFSQFLFNHFSMTFRCSDQRAVKLDYDRPLEQQS